MLSLKWVRITLCTTIFMLLVLPRLYAITLLTKDEALATIFSDADRVEEKKVAATIQQMDTVKKQMGGRLTHVGQHFRSNQISLLEKQTEFTFYIGKKNDTVIGIGQILDEPGKWGPVKFFIRISPDNKIHSAAVMEYKEIRGRPIATRSFLNQFTGKSLSDTIALYKDIQGVAGATISSEASCFVMKKAMVLFKELAEK